MTDLSSIAQTNGSQLRRGDDLLRDKLRSALAARSEDQVRLTALEEARERARQKRWAHSDTVADAEQAVNRAKHTDPVDRVYDFLNTNETSVSSQGLVEAEVALQEAQAEYRNITELEDAIDGEITTVNSRIADRQRAVNDAMAALVSNSPEYQRLFKELDETWARLRGLRKCFATISRLCPQIHPSLSEKGQSVQPLDWTRTGFPNDEQPTQVWSEALARLLQDPNTKLPDMV